MCWSFNSENRSVVKHRSRANVSAHVSSEHTELLSMTSERARNELVRLESFLKRFEVAQCTVPDTPWDWQAMANLIKSTYLGVVKGVNEGRLAAGMCLGMEWTLDLS